MKLFENPNVTFAGIINNKGKLVAGGFRKEFTPYDADKLSMLFLELYLDYSMRREFDSILGKINSITSRRQRVNVTTIPFNDDLILILSEPNTDIENLVETSYKIFNYYFQTISENMFIGTNTVNKL